MGKFEQSLKENLEYNPKTGEITYTQKRGTKNPGDKVGNYFRQGYRTFCFSGKQLDCHRVAWLLHYGDWPKHTIDHINKDKTDNRINNLRDVTQAQNNINKSFYKRVHKLPAGVTKNKNKYQCRINKNGKTISLGYFDCPEEAHKVYLEELNKLLGTIPT